MLIKFCSEAYFLDLRLFNEPEILDSRLAAWSPSRRTITQDFYVLKKNPSTSAGFEPANLSSWGKHVIQKQISELTPFSTTLCYPFPFQDAITCFSPFISSPWSTSEYPSKLLHLLLGASSFWFYLFQYPARHLPTLISAFQLFLFVIVELYRVYIFVILLLYIRIRYTAQDSLFILM